MKVQSRCAAGTASAAGTDRHAQSTGLFSSAVHKSFIKQSEKTGERHLKTFYLNDIILCFEALS